ncbi:hypothetical protein VCRA2121O391_300037 [Vibrio crassostreae]|nr:hypothetical protein VCRA2117O378_320037 [Vibrio crassostreae]CAK2062151.1 hypothetical protein VCRA2113O356_370024 [Vibrio crassostreae]CAK2349241.1 hypothetical protein VCRA2119O386_340036 [Vibrio crassostreae]CAK2751344.1 hypothetical protein VCRA2117O375_290037 [Vibrio crassostreae]CAK2867867.1 hypothetical protein VCRA2121O391_300037 [Vibrio crassostreae]
MVSGTTELNNHPNPPRPTIPFKTIAYINNSIHTLSYQLITPHVFCTPLCTPSNELV